jgi:hypothetical protein
VAIRALTILGLLLYPACTIVRNEGQATPKFGFGALRIVLKVMIDQPPAGQILPRVKLVQPFTINLFQHMAADLQ